MRLLLCCLIAGVGWSSMPTPAAAEEASDPGKVLIEAVRVGDMGRVRAALEADANPNARDGRRWTPLTYAAMGGYVDIADLLIRAGAEVNARASDGSTPLMVAAVMGNYELAKQLLARGADPSLQNAAGADARLKAEQYGHDRLVRLFAERQPAAAPPTVPPRRPPGLSDRSLAVGAGPSASEQVALATSPEAPPEPPPSREVVPDSVEVAPKPPATTPRPPGTSGDPFSGSSAGPLGVIVSESNPEFRLRAIGREYRAIKDAIVRDLPVQTSGRVGAVPGGTRLRVVGKVVGRDWYEVVYDGGVGYVYDRLLEEPGSSEVGASEQGSGSGSSVGPAESAPPVPRAAASARDSGPRPARPSALELATGRWSSSENDRGCARDYLEVRLDRESLTLIVSAAGERTLIAENLPVLSIEGARVLAGRPELSWELLVEPDELLYKVGKGRQVLYRRCPPVL